MNICADVRGCVDTVLSMIRVQTQVLFPQQTNRNMHPWKAFFEMQHMFRFCKKKNDS